ncbi:PQQ-like beta-propeller repeat protein [Diaphorobacter caeni]|uniref:PQQ-like beta-propeller repeat protein n=1 Tax=Diaphorobacter caeni TaxID=2784387 RepID=UPI00188E3A97|nr:PQQ-like beta-propeller repeat protein [Diaphorobacter caeni]MBF5005301.1 PQQ-like beta-propeller repeat protein [Diaphorobacter caeni]
MSSSKYLSGKIVERGIYFFSSRLDSLSSGYYDAAIISACKEGKFFYQPRDLQVESVCIRRETMEEPIRASCVLPRFNSVVGFYPKGGGANDEALPKPPNSGGGVMGQLRQIDGLLYAAGSVGCIYQRISANNWRLLSNGLNTKGIEEYRSEGYSALEAIDLIEGQAVTTCINGGHGKIFIAGHDGKVFFLKGDTWIEVNSNTNAILNDIQIDQSGTVYVSGRGGILLRGDELGFSVIPTNLSEHLKTMAFFEGRLYIGSEKGLYVLDGDVVKPVPTIEKGPFNCVELDSYDGELLVVSDRWFMVFDGKDWKKTVDPDNLNVVD